MIPHLGRDSVRRSPKLKRSARRNLLAGMEQLESRQVLSGSASSPVYNGSVGARNPAGAAPYPLADTFKLHSMPGAEKTVFLDFDGHITTGTAWNTQFNATTITTPPFDNDGNTGSFSDNELELIQRIWQRTAEDFIPFNIDVTTEFVSESLLTKDSPGDTVYGMRAAIGGDFNIIPGLGAAGGVAFVGGFGDEDLSPAFVFATTQGNDEQVVTETISHEVGHTLGLSHDGTSALGYYGGHGTGATSWGPIMGASFGISVTQWNNGTYPDANNQEDDLAIITSLTNQNKFGYRNDDYGNSAATAFPFQFTSLGRGSIDGIIERNTDSDWFRVDIPDGVATIDATPFERGPNLDILLDLLDSGGNLVVSSNPVNALDASIVTTLRGGTYYVRIQGTGKAAVPGDPGYPKYGSLGRYHLDFKVDPSSHVRGTAYLDGDADGARQVQDPPAVGFTAYLDDNLNGVLDATEASTVTDAAGGFDILTVGGPRNVRLVLPGGYFPTDPPSGFKTVIVPLNGGILSGVTLGISGAKGEVHGRKWLDVAGDGTIQPDQGDRPMEGMFIFVDLDRDGKAGIGEPAGVTDANGDFVIRNVPIGPRTLREVTPPGYGVTVPQTNNGTYLINMTPGAILTGLDFWNSPAHDFGDAPDSYSTLLASGGPVHGYVQGYGLGAQLDADADGKPTTLADGDDNAFSDDEDGVVFKSTPSPGKPFDFTVSVRVPSFTPAGSLNAWMDFNRDGDFADAGEKIIAGRVLGTGTYAFSINVPASAVLGRTYLRFRYGMETNIGFGGSAVKGEVEDYSVIVLGPNPVANNDTVTVQQFSVNNPIDVLANDIPSINGDIRIVASSLPARSDLGGRLTLVTNGTPDPSDDFIRYDAAPAPPGTKPYIDKFVYTITDGTRTDDAIVWIQVNRVSTPPTAVDDIATATPSGTTTLFPAMYLGNDIPGTDHGLPYSKVALFSFTADVKDESGAKIGTMSRNTNGTPNDLTDDRLIFTPATGAAGKTGQFTYTARNPDTDNPAVGDTATVTVQVHAFNVVDNNDIVKLSIDVRNVAADGGPAGTSPTELNQGQKYWVGIFADDLRSQFLDKNGNIANGALSVYLDLLFDRNYVSPVRVTPTDRNPAGVNIRYGAQYASGSTGFSGDAGTGGLINELGVTSGEEVVGTGNLPVIFVQFVANRPTPGTAGVVIWKTDPADLRNSVDPSFTHDVTVVNRADTTKLQDLPLTNIAYFASRAFRILPLPLIPPSSATLAPTTTSTATTSTTTRTPTAPQEPVYTTSATTKTYSALDAAMASLFAKDDPYKK